LFKGVSYARKKVKMITPKMRRRMDILLVDDGSPRFLDAVRFLRDLPISRAAFPRSSVMLFGIVEPNQTFDWLIRQTFLEQAKEWLGDKGLKVETRLEIGRPLEKLVQVSRELQPDLVMLGSKSRLSRISETLVRRLDRSLLVVRRPYAGLRSVLAIASSEALRAVNYLSKFPLPNQAEVQVLSVRLDSLQKTKNMILAPLEQRAVQILGRERIKASRWPNPWRIKRRAEKFERAQFDMVVLGAESLARLVDQKNNTGKGPPFDARCAMLVVTGNREACGFMNLSGD
jgi:nucleotide-binding universal stress UspA family protein